MIIGKDSEGSCRDLILRYYVGFRLEVLRKNMKILSQDSRCPSPDMNPLPHEYEAGMLTTGPRNSKDETCNMI
jgi:hypothetical protein